jgi:hypothetical protein
VPDATRKCCKCFNNEVLLGVGLFACFCLSWVGAICDADTDPLCLGNNTIHSTCAVLFFALTDVIALAMVCKPKSETDRRPARRAFNGLVALVMSGCTLVRGCKVFCEHYGSSYGPQNGDNFVIIAEVIEVTLFCVFLNNTAWGNFEGLSWAAVSTPEPDSSDRTVKVCAPAQTLATAGVYLAVGVVALSLLIGELDGTLPSGVVPSLSDLGTQKPCNWLWRWAMVQAASAGLWGLGFSQVAAAAGANWKAADLVLMVLGFGSTLCMAGMAIINQDEQATYHAWLLAGFFVLGDAYALGFVAVDSKRHAAKAAAAKASATAGNQPPLAPQVFAVVAALTTIRGATPFMAPASSLAASNAAAVLEWVNALALFAFFYTNCTHRDATEQMSLSFLIDDNSSAKATHEKGGVAVSMHTTDLA